MTQKERITALENRLLATRAVLAVLIATLALDGRIFTDADIDVLAGRAADELAGKPETAREAVGDLMANCRPGQRKPLDY